LISISTLSIFITKELVIFCNNKTIFELSKKLIVIIFI
jgi:hypothetical protein